MKKFLLTCFLVVLSLAFVGCQKACEHEASKQWEADDATHWHVCTICGEKLDEAEHTWGEWKTSVPASVGAEGSEYRQCSVCKKSEQRAIPAIVLPTGVASADTVVYAQVPADWTNVNLYYWGDEIESTKSVGWPGYAMACVDETNNIWAATVPAGTANLIFNNGSAQTADLLFGTEDNLYKLTTTNAEGKYLADYEDYTQTSDVKVPTYPISEPETFTTVYVKVPTSWTTQNVHYWGSKPGTTWPGKALTAVDAATGVYSFELSSTVTGIIINNKVGDEGVQTSNILPKEGVNGYVVSEDGSFQECSYADGAFTPVEVYVPTVLYVRGVGTWDPIDENKLTVDGANASIQVTLVADDQFKVATAGWDIQFNSANTTFDSAAFVAAGENIKCVVAGTYLITVTNYDTAERACTITLVPAE